MRKRPRERYYLCLKLSSEHVDGAASRQRGPVFDQPVFEGEG